MRHRSLEPRAPSVLSGVGSKAREGDSSGGPAPGRLLRMRLAQIIQANGGWIGFDRFMAVALTEPGLGYYSRGGTIFGTMPSDGSDFSTAPEMSPLFGRALARQVAEALQAGAPPIVTEFGAGSGALAATVLDTLDRLGHDGVTWRIVDVSASLRQRQAVRLEPWAARVQWCAEWPATLDGVVLGNEVLDAMPVQLLHWDGAQWFERGVALQEAPPGADDGTGADEPRWAFADRPTTQRPPVAPDWPFVPATTVEVHAQAEAFVRGVVERLHRGLALFIDYGFPEAEFYLPERTGGTLMCHRAHRSDTDVLADVGDKDLTAHVNFTGLALVAQAAGAEVLGYTSQARFLFNNGFLDDLASATVAERAAAQRLVTEHEMGELFKVIAFGRGLDYGPDGRSPPCGFVEGDRTHRL